MMSLLVSSWACALVISLIMLGTYPFIVRLSIVRRLIGSVHLKGTGNLWSILAVHVPVTAIGVSIISVLTYLGHLSTEYYKEIWSSATQMVIYTEEWTESKQIYSTDKHGRTKVKTVLIYHEPSWNAVSEFNDEQSITKTEYLEWKNRWQNEKKVDLIRFGQTSWGDGNRYICQWPETADTLRPFSVIHRYLNKVRATKTVWNMNDESVKPITEFPRPADIGNYSAIISPNFNITSDDQLQLDRINARLGPVYQVHAIVYLLDSRIYTDMSIARKIIASWQGPNKNEFIVIIGMDDTNLISWCDVFSWMDDTTIHSIMRQDILDMAQWNPTRYGQILEENIGRYWKRKEFADFDYLTVDMSVGAFVINICLSILMTFGTYMFFAHKAAQRGW